MSTAIVVAIVIFSMVTPTDASTVETISPRRLARPVLPVSSAEAQGLSSNTLVPVYQQAAGIPGISSLLIVKNGYLVAEQYFPQPQQLMVEDRGVTAPLTPVTPSIISTLVGIALRDGYLTSLDQRMMTLFPEYDTPELDPRKRDITIRHLLQMRAGYPADSTELVDRLSRSSDWLRYLIVEHQLTTSPGTSWHESKVSIYLLAGILTRVTGIALYDFADLHLFEPMGLAAEYQPSKTQSHGTGDSGIYLSPRQLACFARLMLDRGYFSYRGEQVSVVPSDWIDESFQEWSSQPALRDDAWPLRNVRYGYLWWHAEIDDHEVRLAWSDGQLIMIVADLDLVIVTTSAGAEEAHGESPPVAAAAALGLIANDILPTIY